MYCIIFCGALGLLISFRLLAHERKRDLNPELITPIHSGVSIAGFVLALIANSYPETLSVLAYSFLGLTLSIVGLVQSTFGYFFDDVGRVDKIYVKRYKNGLAIAGIIISLMTILGTFYTLSILEYLTELFDSGVNEPTHAIYDLD